MRLTLQIVRSEIAGVFLKKGTLLGEALDQKGVFFSFGALGIGVFL